MTYEAPMVFGDMTVGSMELVFAAAIVPIVIALLVGLRRETAVVAGVISALAVLVAG